MNHDIVPIEHDIYAIKDSFQMVLSNKSLSFEREAEFAIQALYANSTSLNIALSNRQSVINAVTNIAAIGISLNPAKKQAYLVPRKGGICLDISYIGLLDLATESKAIIWGQSKLVRQNDKFTLGRLDEMPDHPHDPFDKNRGAVVGVYVVIKTAGGDFLTHTMAIDDVLAIRDRSEAWKSFKAKQIRSCPWVTDEGEMIKKTCIKQASKMWPKSASLDRAIHYLNTAGGEGIDFTESTAGKVTSAVNVELYIKKAQETKTDTEAFAFWKANVGMFLKQPDDARKFKEAVIAHRTLLLQVDEARTIDAPVSSPAMKTGKSSKTGLSPALLEMAAEMESAAEQGIDFLERIWNQLSKATKEKLESTYLEIRANCEDGVLA